MKFQFSKETARPTILNLLLLLFVALAVGQTGFAQEKNLNRPIFNSSDSLAKVSELYEREAYDSALAICNTIHPGDTLYKETLMEEIRLLAQLERYDEAIELCNEGLALNKGNESTFLNFKALLYTGQEKHAKALETYDAAIKKYPTSYSLFYSRAQSYRALERYEEALKDYQKVVELNPYHFLGHKNLAIMALNEQKYSQALMALGYCILIDPTHEEINGLLVAFDQAVSADFEYEPKGLDLEKSEKFKTDLMVKSYIALEDDYEIDTDIDIALTRQMHLVFSQLKKHKTGKGFWGNYYQPYYEALMEEDYFEEFTMLLAASSGSEYHQDVISRNTSATTKMVEWTRDKLAEIHNFHHEGYHPNNEKVRFFYHDNSWHINAIGDLNGAGQPVGLFKFFYESGALSSTGNFNKNGEREGRWISFHENGDTARVVYYQAGVLDGPNREYHSNGNLSVRATYKTDKPHGRAEIFDRHGNKVRQINFVEGTIEDTLYNYHSDGTISGALPYTAGETQGTAKYYNRNGVLKSIIPYVDDQREGKGTFYHYNKQLEANAAYEEGMLSGPYTSYYSNGQLESEGNYVEGVRSGKWKSYNPAGVLISEESYDEKGKQTGTYISYDNSGRKIDEYEYSKGEIKAYKQFDLEGNITHQDSEKWGKFYFKTYNIYGNVQSEGHYDGDHKEGPWIYYDEYGQKEAEEHFDDEGVVQGVVTNYYPNGQTESVYHYTDGELDGYYVEYYDHGDISEEGWYVDGREQGFHRTFKYDGSLHSEAFYVNDEINGPKSYYDENGAVYLRKYFDQGVLYKTENLAGDSVYYTSEYNMKNDFDEAKYPNGQFRYHINSAGNLYNGLGKWYYGNGQVQKTGSYRNGYFVGEWKWFHPNGELAKVGSYGLIEPVGTWKEYHTNGKPKAVYTFLEGERHGAYQDFYESGQVSDSGQYYLGQLHGKRYFIQENGEINHVRIYDHGRIVGYVKKPDAKGNGEVVKIENGTADVKSFYPNGKVARQYQLVNGDFQGRYLQYNPDGSLSYESNYKDDNRMGVVKSYYQNGSLKRKESRVDGYLHGTVEEYHPNGKLKVKMNYDLGRLNGEYLVYDESGTLIHKYLYRSNMLTDEI